MEKLYSRLDESQLRGAAAPMLRLFDQHAPRLHTLNFASPSRLASAILIEFQRQTRDRNNAAADDNSSSAALEPSSSKRKRVVSDSS